MKTPNDLINMLRRLKASDFRRQLEHDRDNRISRYILVSEFIQDALEQAEYESQNRESIPGQMSQ